MRGPNRPGACPTPLASSRSAPGSTRRRHGLSELLSLLAASTRVRITNAQVYVAIEIASVLPCAGARALTCADANVPPCQADADEDAIAEGNAA